MTFPVFGGSFLLKEVFIYNVTKRSTECVAPEHDQLSLIISDQTVTQSLHLTTAVLYFSPVKRTSCLQQLPDSLSTGAKRC